MLFGTINKNGTTCNFEKLKPIQIIKRLKAIAGAYKVTIDDNTLQYLIELSRNKHAGSNK
jgi:DNA polymerase III gamma/tau subunit